MDRIEEIEKRWRDGVGIAHDAIIFLLMEIDRLKGLVADKAEKEAKYTWLKELYNDAERDVVTLRKESENWKWLFEEEIKRREAAEAALAGATDKAAKFLGTDDEFKSMVCIDVAISHAETLRSELNVARATIAEKDRLLEEAVEAYGMYKDCDKLLSDREIAKLNFHAGTLYHLWQVIKKIGEVLAG